MVKLVEIKNVRVGQVRKIIIMDFHAENTKEVIGVFTRANDSSYDEFDWIAEYYDAKTKISIGDYEDWTFEDCGELIGKLGITHKIEDNKLIEIPQSEDRYVGDIIKDNDNIEHLIMEIFEENYYDDCECFYHLFCNKYKISTKSEVSVSKFNKIGIYGVTHEFVNDCEVQDD